MGTMIYQLNPKIRRILALIIDILFVVAIGTSVGTVFRSFLIDHSNIAYFIGFVVAWLYHSVSNSFIKDGQTAGKILVGLKVVDKSGKRIGIIRSLLRSLPIVICFFGEPAKTPDFWKEAITYLITPLWISLAYFSIFFPCCRTTHDFIFGTAVTDTQNKENSFSYKTSTTSIIVIALISATLLGLRSFSGSSSIADRQLVDKLKKSQEQIEKIKGVEDASIQLEGEKYTIGIITKNNPSESMPLAVRASCLFLENFSFEHSSQQIQVVVMRGFDMKIYHHWDVLDHTFTASKWLTKCPDNR